MAFKCQQCGSIEFKVQLASPATAQLRWEYNEHEDLVFTIEGQNTSFVADLGFMNRFASCANCHATRSWQYRFTKKEVNA
jgi:hypothetical protein